MNRKIMNRIENNEKKSVKGEHILIYSNLLSWVRMNLETITTTTTIKLSNMILKTKTRERKI